MEGCEKGRGARARGLSPVRATGLPMLVAAMILAAGLMLTACTSQGSTTTSGSVPPTTATTVPTTATSSTTTTASTSTTLSPGDGVVTEADRLSPETGHYSICKDCHAFLDPPNRKRPALNPDFSHAQHLADYGAVCDSCHLAPVHTENGVRKPPMSQCFDCHGSGPDAKAPSNCDFCHPADFPTMPASHTEAFFQGGHGQIALTEGTTECFLCHQAGQEGFCLACHGLPMPHPDGWALAPSGGPGAHVQAAYDDGRVCVHCHHNTVNPPANCYGGECHGS